MFVDVTNLKKGGLYTLIWLSVSEGLSGGAK